MLILPTFEITKKQPKVPHVARTVVVKFWPNKHGAEIEYKVKQSRNGKDWWISAGLDGYRWSNTLHTSKAATAADWIAAVTTGKITVAAP